MGCKEQGAAGFTVVNPRGPFTFILSFVEVRVGLETKEKESAFGMVDRRAELSASSWCARLVLGPGAVLGVLASDWGQVSSVVSGSWVGRDLGGVWFIGTKL